MAKFSSVVIAAVFVPMVLLAPVAKADQDHPPETGFTLLTDQVTSDFKYLADNIQMDAVDVVTSPLYVTSENSLLRSPGFYVALAGGAAALGGSFALDQTIRARLRNMGHTTANDLQDVSYAGVGAASAIVYAYGLYSDDAKMRETMLTAGEGAGVATLLALALKSGIGRLRPYQDHHSHTKFFDHGQSFPSGEVTPVFALAAGVSEAFDNQWYVAVPAYSLALTDGFGRMGNDAHWLSDVAGAALLGVGTTELLLYMHRRHAVESDRWRIFPVSGSPSRRNETPMGLGISYNF